jgi:hypothetical protein
MIKPIKPLRIYRHTNGIWRAEIERDDGKLIWFSLRTRDEAMAKQKWERYLELVARYHRDV